MSHHYHDGGSFSTDEPERGVFETTEQKVNRYRLTRLTHAYGKTASEYSPDVFSQLDQLACCGADLHHRIKAFEQGCTLAQAVAIFT